MTAAGVIQIVRAMPLADRQMLLGEMVKAFQIIPATRAGDVLSTVVRVLPKQQIWTAQQIKDEVAAAGIKARSRDIFNAIGYLRRKGNIERVGQGEYRIPLSSRSFLMTDYCED